MTDEVHPKLAAWASDQRALARVLGLSIEDWLAALGVAGERRTGLQAAVVGAAVAEGLGLGVLAKLDPPALVAMAKTLIDPTPPKVDDPVLAEAIRRGEIDAALGKGAARLRRRDDEEASAPDRDVRPIGPSASTATADAPGDD